MQAAAMTLGMSPDRDVVTVDPAYWTHRGPSPHMAESHRHDDLEINLALAGTLRYRFGGAPLLVDAGQIALFWAWTPHQMVGAQHEAEYRCVHIPITEVLAWGLSDRELGALLLDRPVIVPSSAAGRDVESMLASWQHEFDDEAGAAIVSLEAHALVRRLLRHASAGPTDGAGDTERAGGRARVIEMVRFIVERFRDPIGIKDVAAAAHLHPHYAMTIFRRDVGTTIVEYLIRCRVAEAQRLLLSTSMTTIEVAHASGFGSQSSFYAHFARACGAAPAAYRSQRR